MKRDRGRRRTGNCFLENGAFSTTTISTDWITRSIGALAVQQVMMIAQSGQGSDAVVIQLRASCDNKTYGSSSTHIDGRKRKVIHLM